MAVNKLPIISRNILYIRKVKFKTQQALADEICGILVGIYAQKEKGRTGVFWAIACIITDVLLYLCGRKHRHRPVTKRGLSQKDHVYICDGYRFWDHDSNTSQQEA